MTRVLISAYEPYDDWPENASWLALVELTKSLPQQPQVTTRRYPVDFAIVKQRLEEDLAADFDYAILLGQAPGATVVQLEAVGINVGGRRDQQPQEFFPLAEDGPAAYRTTLPLAEYVSALSEAGIPAVVSYHAGTYLCNAALYLAHYFAERRGLRTKAVFLHLPLAVSQVVGMRRPVPTMDTLRCAEALRLILARIEKEQLP